MLWVITYPLCCIFIFVGNKVYNKITTYCMHSGVKLIKYHASWHKKRDIWDDLIDWCFV